MSKFFGSTITETRNALLGQPASETPKARKDPMLEKQHAWARIVITILLLGTSIYFIAVGISPDVGKLIMGAILGYWMK